MCLYFRKIFLGYTNLINIKKICKLNIFFNGIKFEVWGGFLITVLLLFNFRLLDPKYYEEAMILLRYGLFFLNIFWYVKYVSQIYINLRGLCRQPAMNCMLQ